MIFLSTNWPNFALIAIFA